MIYAITYNDRTKTFREAENPQGAIAQLANGHSWRGIEPASKRQLPRARRELAAREEAVKEARRRVERWRLARSL